MTAKQRHYASILRETDIVMKQIERTYGPEKEADYENICTLRNMAFIELVKNGFPFISLSDEDVIRLSYDEKTYDMPRSQLLACVGEEEFQKIMAVKTFKNTENEEGMAEESRFEKLKKKLEEYQSGFPLRIEDEIAAIQEEMKTDVNAYRLDDIKKTDSSRTMDVNNPEKQDLDEIVDVRISKRGIARTGGTAEIGFIGLERGAGTTHTAIMCAQVLAEDQNTDVAYFEANKHGHMMSMAAWITGEPITKTFPIGNVDYYFGMSYLAFLSKYKDMYDYVVIDFGCYGTDDDVSDFVRVNNRFVVADGADWNLPALERFYNTYMFDRAHVINYLIPFSDESQAAQVRNDIGIKNQVFPVPFEHSPFDISEESKMKIAGICGIKKEEQQKEQPLQVVPKKKKKKWFSR